MNEPTLNKANSIRMEILDLKRAIIADVIPPTEKVYKYTDIHPEFFDVTVYNERIQAKITSLENLFAAL